MKLTTVVFGILLPFYAASEPKELFCAKEWGAKDVNGSEFSTREAYLERLPEDVAKYKKLEQEMIADYGYDSNLAQSYRDLKNNTIGEMELCKTSPWFDSYSFLFDTNGLKNATESDVEMGIQRYCGAKKEDMDAVCARVAALYSRGPATFIPLDQQQQQQLQQPQQQQPAASVS